MMKAPGGIVFDIQRCSLNDGPGIRTTVFLKGCPLHCVWCHNPESQKRKPSLYFSSMRCSNCGQCAKACPQRCIFVCTDSHTIDRTQCILCGQCLAVCPNSALEIKGTAESLQSVMDVVLRDSVYYQDSGGGITLSGGEPMAQYPFALALLRRCKEEGIHTCLETCGYATTHLFAELMPFVDLFLYDYKATGIGHEGLTGVDQALILSNLNWIINHGGNVILRCPLVPGINDFDEHLKAIAALELHYPQLVGVDILPYHNMGSAKAKSAGMPYALGSIPNASEEQKEQWISRLREYGSQMAQIR